MRMRRYSICPRSPSTPIGPVSGTLSSTSSTSPFDVARATPFWTVTTAHVHGVPLHLLQQRLGHHRLGHEDGGPGDPADGGIPPAGFVTEAELHQVFEVEHAHDVVSLVVDDGHARDALLEEDRHRLTRGRRGIHRHHVGARNHHGAHERVGEVEHRVDQLAVVLLDELVLGGLVDDAEQLLLRREGRAARRTRGDAHADGDVAVGERPEDHAHSAPHRRCSAEQALRVLPPEGARARADDDV